MIDVKPVGNFVRLDQNELTQLQSLDLASLVIYPALESVADELHIRQPDMFYLAALNKPLFDLEILLARRGMFQCSDKFSNCFPRLDNSTTHRDMIFRHLDIWRFDTAVLKLLSRVSGLSADARSRQCADSYNQ